ncbi:MAG: cobalamin-independent methionine synthase II family protein, partial [Ardenticatenales bacterium]
VFIPDRLPEPAPAAPIAPLSVMGIGSWPRPAWLGRLLHERLEGRLDEAAFEAAADDAVRLAVAAQERAGVDVVTDGEQRRDNYASFVGARLDNCQLIPLVDLLPLVDDPAHFEAEMRSLDIPAAEVRHPAVFGPLSRRRGIATHELAFARTLTERPVKVALPGPYLLSRTMWLECVADQVYASREALADDIVRVLREEVHDLLAGGAAIVQFDEPVLTEVVFSGATGGRSFMCGALSDRRDAAHELAFAHDLLMRVTAGLPRQRLALHICRGNWSRDEANALAGDYRPLLPFLADAPVGTLFLELCTPRAGEIEVLAELPQGKRIGVGVVNQKHGDVEPVDAIVRRIERAVRVFGAERVLLTPDCGFATFADAPMAGAGVAERKLGAIVRAVGVVTGGDGRHLA